MDKQEIIDDDMRRFEAILNEAAQLRYKKVQDYGVETYKLFGIYGITLRLNDKLNRIKNHYDLKLKGENSDLKISHESIRDTLIDLLNYSAMGIMILDQEFEEMVKENADK